MKVYHQHLEFVIVTDNASPVINILRTKAPTYALPATIDKASCNPIQCSS